ncbi:MAG: site-2 protease family protein [Epulopiscium sp.]|nr:site-2 protease family protein [Candidatus Epulonipiscium sp.]
MTNPILDILIKLPGILCGLTFHEFTHGIIAHFFGDLTPKKEGRLTLNPIPHVDPIGLILLLFMNFGWARPIHTNPSNFKNKKKAMILVSLGGPIANLFVAAIFAIILKLMNIYHINAIQYNWAFEMVNYGIMINIVLGIFNLVPIPPLDGSKILFNIIPPRTYFKIIQYEYILQMLLIILLLTGIIPMLINPVITYIYKFLLTLMGLM